MPYAPWTNGMRIPPGRLTRVTLVAARGQAAAGPRATPGENCVNATARELAKAAAGARPWVGLCCAAAHRPGDSR
jgi:hypothetical protein